MKGKGLGLLIGMGPASKEEEPDDDAPVLAAKAMIAAVKSGDAAALSAALREHYAACKGVEKEVEAD